MSPLSCLTNLETLILSFNEIKQIQGLSMCKSLKTLDLNHNFISQIEGLIHCQKLDDLNLGNNWISNPTDLIHLKEFTPNLSSLWLKANPLSSQKHYKSLLL